MKMHLSQFPTNNRPISIVSFLLRELAAVLVQYESKQRNVIGGWQVVHIVVIAHSVAPIVQLD
jgi:hypothetical protein